MIVVSPEKNPSSKNIANPNAFNATNTKKSNKDNKIIKKSSNSSNKNNNNLISDKTSLSKSNDNSNVDKNPILSKNSLNSNNDDYPTPVHEFSIFAKSFSKNITLSNKDLAQNENNEDNTFNVIEVEHDSSPYLAPYNLHILYASQLYIN